MKHFHPFLFLFTLSLLSGCGSEITPVHEKNEVIQIREKFNDWKKEMIRKGIFFGKDSCDPNFCAKNIERLISQQGIPDTNEINYLFADINKDRKLDGLITFRPILCSATTPLTCGQFRVLILSGKDGYRTDDTYFSHIKMDTIAFRIGDLEILGMSDDQFFGVCDIMINKKYEQDERIPAQTRKLPVIIKFTNRELLLLDQEPSNGGAVMMTR
jgi:hypothetical protein